MVRYFHSIVNIIFLVLTIAAVDAVYECGPGAQVVNELGHGYIGCRILNGTVDYYPSIPYTTTVPKLFVHGEPAEWPTSLVDLRNKPSAPSCRQPPASYQTTILLPTTLYVPGLPLFHNDCRYTNLFVPVRQPYHATTEKFPVVNWNYGGGGDTGGCVLYDVATGAIRHRVIYACANYRLGPNGFLATGRPHTRENYGLGDEIAHNEWLREFVSYFGGDVTRITDAGQSFGAGMVLLKRVWSSNARDQRREQRLFQQSEASSPFGVFNLPFCNQIARDSTETPAVFAARHLGCPNSPNNMLTLDAIACLQSKSDAEIDSVPYPHSGVANSGSSGNVRWLFGPCIDGVSLKDQWNKLILDNNNNNNDNNGPHSSLVEHVDTEGRLFGAFDATTFLGTTVTASGFRIVLAYMTRNWPLAIPAALIARIGSCLGDRSVVEVEDPRCLPALWPGAVDAPGVEPNFYFATLELRAGLSVVWPAVIAGRLLRQADGDDSTYEGLNRIHSSRSADSHARNAGQTVGSTLYYVIYTLNELRGLIAEAAYRSYFFYTGKMGGVWRPNRDDDSTLQEIGYCSTPDCTATGANVLTIPTTGQEVSVWIAPAKNATSVGIRGRAFLLEAVINSY